MAEKVIFDVEYDEQQIFIAQQVDAATCTNNEEHDQNTIQIDGVSGEEIFTMGNIDIDDESNEKKAACNIIIQQQQNIIVENEVVVINSSMEQLDTDPRDGISVDDPFEKLEAESWQEMSERIEKFYNRTATRFVTFTYKGMKESLKDVNFKEPHKVYWQNVIGNNGLTYEEPYIMVGRSNLQCQFGNDQNVTKKMTRKRELELKGKWKGPRTTKKIGCPAIAYLKRIIKFPDYKFEIAKMTVRKKKNTSKLLREKLKKEPHTIKMKEFFTGVFPPLSHHRYHENVGSCVEPVCKEVIFKIQELALQNNSFNTIIREIDNYVTKDLFFQRQPPEKTRRRYYPRCEDVRKIARRARDAATLLPQQLRHLQHHFEYLSLKYPRNTTLFQIDDLPVEEAILKKPINLSKITETQSEDEVDEHDETSNNTKDNNKKSRNKRIPKLQKLIFFYQSPNQQNLLMRYGSTVYLTEVQPTEPGSRAYTVSMYLLAVRTNVDHQVVGTILVEKYSKGDSVKEALLKCKEVNSSWTPKYFMVDKDESLSNAIVEHFPESAVYYTKSSCYHLWRYFLSQTSNGLVGHCDEILTYLNAMRISTSKDELTNAASALEQSQIWQQSELLRTWFQTEWLPIAERWVRDYLPPDLSCFVQEDCSIDHLHLYQDALLKTTLKTVEGATVRLVETLTTTLAEKSYQSYVAKNKELYKTCKRLQNENPMWEIEFGIPFHLYSHASTIVENLFSAGSIIAQLDHGYYEITVVNDDTSTKEEHITSLGNDTVFPACTCGEWKRNAVPCWHMFTVFKNSPHVKYDSMGGLYRSNALFGMDYSCLAENDLLTAKTTRNASMQTQNSKDGNINQGSDNQITDKIVDNTSTVTSPISPNNTGKRQSKYSKLIADLKEKHIHKKVKRTEDKIVRIVENASCSEKAEVLSPTKKPNQGNMKLRERRLVSKPKRGWVAGTSVVGANVKFPTLRTVKVKSIADVLREMPDEVVEQIKKTHLKQKQLQQPQQSQQQQQQSIQKQQQHLKQQQPQSQQQQQQQPPQPQQHDKQRPQKPPQPLPKPQQHDKQQQQLSQPQQPQSHQPQQPQSHQPQQQQHDKQHLSLPQQPQSHQPQQQQHDKQQLSLPQQPQPHQPQQQQHDKQQLSQPQQPQPHQHDKQQQHPSVENENNELNNTNKDDTANNIPQTNKQTIVKTTATNNLIETSGNPIGDISYDETGMVEHELSDNGGTQNELVNNFKSRQNASTKPSSHKVLDTQTLHTNNSHPTTSLIPSDTNFDISHKGAQHEHRTKNEGGELDLTYLNRNSISFSSDDTNTITTSNTAHTEHEQRNHIILKLLQDDQEASSSMITSSTNTISTDDDHDHIVITTLVQAQGTGDQYHEHDHEENFDLLSIATKRKAEDDLDEEESVKKMKY